MVPRQDIHVLCVDDDPRITTMLRMVLETSGYDVDVAENGLAGLRQLNRALTRYPVVITDMRMPGLDGYAFISEARTAGYAGAFVAFAGALSPDDHLRLRDLRVARVLEKPSRPGEIVDAVRQALGRY